MAGGRLLSVVLLLASVTVTASALVGEHGIPHLIGLRAEREDLGRTAFAARLGDSRRLARTRVRPALAAIGLGRRAGSGALRAVVVSDDRDSCPGGGRSA